MKIIFILAGGALLAGGLLALLNSPAPDYLATADSLKNLIFSEGPDRALSEAKKIIDRQGFDDGYCHVVMHRLGRAAYQHFGDLETALGSGDLASGICSAGYVHGVIEAYFKGVADPVAAAPGACERYRSVNPQLFGNCTHGIGHGFMFFTDNDLPKSLAMCGQLQEGRTTCASGVFMENFNASKSTGHETKFAKLDDLFYPCAEQPKYQSQCYFYSADHFLIYRPKQYGALINWCQGAGDPQYIGECVIRAGHRAFQDSYPDQKTPQLVCALAPERYKGKCFEGIARGYKFFFSAPDKAIEFCRKILDPAYRRYCPPQYQ